MLSRFFQAKGLTHISPGQRPGNASPQYFKALNGRNNTRRVATLCVAPTGLWIHETPIPRASALGWYAAHRWCGRIAES